MTTNNLGSNLFQGSTQFKNREEIEAAERDIKAREEALGESRQRLEAAKAEQRRIAAITQKAAAIQSGMTDDEFGRMSRQVTVWDILQLFKGEIINTNVNPAVLHVNLADAMAIMRAISETPTGGEASA